MVTKNCYYCGSEQYTFYAEENGYNLVKCSVCGLLFIENRPSDSEISQSQKQGIHSGSKSINTTGRYWPEKTTWYLKVLDDLFDGEFGNKNTWLDVGCGYGELMKAIQTYNSKVIVKGTEPNVHKQESARKRGLDVSYFDLDSHDKKYDVVSLLNVYSHLPNPQEFLNSIKKILEPNGELILETGDTADLAAKDHHRPFLLPDHLSFVSEKIMVGLLERLGFEILSIKKYPIVRFNFVTIAKEFVKAILPNYPYPSKLKYYFTNSRTDMFIRARLKS